MRRVSMRVCVCVCVREREREREKEKEMRRVAMRAGNRRCLIAR